MKKLEATESKDTGNFIEKTINEKLESLVSDMQRKGTAHLINELATRTLKVNMAKKKIKELQIVIDNKDDTIEHLNNQCIELKINLERIEQDKGKQQTRNNSFSSKERIQELEIITKKMRLKYI